MAPRTRGESSSTGNVDGGCRVDTAVHRAVVAPLSPVSAAAPAVAAAAVEEIRLEFKRGTIGVSVTWPVSAAANCGAWLREVLR